MAGRPGRREQPIDPRGPLERFALELRALRVRAGLTYAEMALGSCFSASTLSQAAAGQRLPTREVLRAYVRVCGGEPHAWEERWEGVRREVRRNGNRRKDARPRPHDRGHAEATSFVGRETELLVGTQLLERCRLVTLVGTGGVGKTRLARNIVRAAADRFEDGTHWAELADLGSGGGTSVAATVAAAVGVQVAAGEDPVHALAGALRHRKFLLLLDNCEHVLDGCARTVDALLARLPELRVLATSRQPLDVGGEHVLRVEPLGLPDTANGHLSGTPGPGGEDAAVSPAVTLFVDRATAASPGFRVTEANRHVIARVCQRLDGLPLALEIAARRLRTLTVEELLERLDDRFRLLGPGGSDRTAHPRHQALRALFDWSYELCTEAEASAWEQLSLCAGGVLLTDAEQLCTRTDDVGDGGVTKAAVADEPFEALAGLVDKSLLTRVDADGRTRLHMLETVRAYGQERLARSGRARQALTRHRAWYLGLAARAGSAYGTPAEAGWLRRLRAEHSNLRQIVTAPPPADESPEVVLRASLGFWLHGLTSAEVGETAGWMRRILERHPSPASPDATTTWCRAAWVAGFLFLLHGDHGGSLGVIARGERALTGLHAEPGTALRTAHENAQAELGAAFLQLRSLAALVTGDMETTVEYAQASLAAGPGSVVLLTEAQCVAQLGFAAVIAGDRPRSTALLERALQMSEARGDTWHRCYLLWALAVDHCEAERPERAMRFLRQALQHTRKIDEHLGEATLGETLAWILSSQGDAHGAAVVLGAVDRVWLPSGTPRLFGFARLNAHCERCLRDARGELGDSEFARLYQEGRRLGLRHALETAFRNGRPADTASRADA
ncbi:ATP-binding protein [Streptomyces sp. NPDC088090]|uniref:ATP-binding protein n=1 Tax=Streptomyces sp. NPDC088090 TaxID=3365822 RepID=UPI003850E233